MDRPGGCGFIGRIVERQGVRRGARLAGGRRWALGGLIWLCLLWIGGPAGGAGPGTADGRWREEDFHLKTTALARYPVRRTPSPVTARTVFGHRRFYRIQPGDTLLDIGRFYDLGYNEITAANARLDPWVPTPGATVLLPTEWILPEMGEARIVVNIPEMRLYYLEDAPAGAGAATVVTFPVGLGRRDWRTPVGTFRVRGKTENPTWVIPESIRRERIAEQGYSERSIPGGSPDNPLGAYRIELTLSSYAIHGTNIPWGVGMQVSHGCVRLYPEDIEQLFPRVAVGEKGAFVYQPVKVGARDGRVFVEVHPDIYTRQPGLYREARALLSKLGWSDWVDPERLKEAVAEQSGVPTDVTRSGSADRVAPAPNPDGGPPQ